MILKDADECSLNNSMRSSPAHPRGDNRAPFDPLLTTSRDRPTALRASHSTSGTDHTLAPHGRSQLIEKC
jgi:hypothetical protein